MVDVLREREINYGRLDSVTSARAILLGIVLPILDLIWNNASVFARTLVDGTLIPSSLAFAFELITAGAELSNGLFGQQLLQCPLLDILLLVLLELLDELNGTLQNGALVLLTARDNLC
jgi:hypothetical protein